MLFCRLQNTVLFCSILAANKRYIQRIFNESELNLVQTFISKSAFCIKDITDILPNLKKYKGTNVLKEDFKKCCVGGLILEHASGDYRCSGSVKGRDKNIF